MSVQQLKHGLIALYQALVKQHNALKSLKQEYEKHLERERILGDILNNLRSNYNPNYQDMAVLEAVRGWEYQANLPHINDVNKDDQNVEEDPAELGVDEPEEIEEGIWTAEELERDLPVLLHTDYESLLIEHDKHVGASASESIRAFPSLHQLFGSC